VCVASEPDAVTADRVSVKLCETLREIETLRCPDTEAVRVDESGGDAVGLCSLDSDAVSAGEID
jgi:hypothetical protein